MLVPTHPVKVKLMGLDFVLVHQQHHYLATEAEKLDDLADKLGLISHLSRVSTDRGTARNTSTRYFADKSPLFLSGASRAPRPVVAFCYVDGTTGKPLLDTYLLQYRDLFSRLDGFKIIFVAADERRFPKESGSSGACVGVQVMGCVLPEIPISSDCTSTFGLGIGWGVGRRVLDKARLDRL